MKSENRLNQYIFDRLEDIELENFYSLKNTLNKVDYFVDNIHLSSKGHKVVAKKIISIISLTD